MTKSSMKRLVEWFDRAYIINLRDRVDRRRDTEREFRKIGLEIPNSQIQFYTASRPTEKAGFPSLGARGSYTSHRDVLDLALTDNLKNVLIFEDDILFRGIDASTLDSILHRLSQESWDLVYFGYGNPRSDLLTGPLTIWSGETIGGHFYAVNGRFISTMSSYMHECETRNAGHPLGGPTFRDGAYNNIRRLNPQVRTFLAVPSLGTQRSSRTDLHPLKIYDRLNWLAPAMRSLRGFRTRLRS